MLPLDCSINVCFCESARCQVERRGKLQVVSTDRKVSTRNFNPFSHPFNLSYEADRLYRASDRVRYQDVCVATRFLRVTNTRLALYRTGGMPRHCGLPREIISTVCKRKTDESGVSRLMAEINLRGPPERPLNHRSRGRRESSSSSTRSPRG